MIEGLRDAAEAGIDAARGNGEETRRIGIDEGRAAADEDQAGGDAEPVTHGLVDKPVETAECNQYPDGDDRAGGSITHCRKTIGPERETSRCNAHGVSNGKAQDKRDHRRQPGKEDGVKSLIGETGRQAAEAEALPSLNDEIARGCYEADQDRQTAEHEGDPALQAGEPQRFQFPAFLCRNRVTLLAPRPALERHKGDNDEQHGERDLCRTRKVGFRDPCGVDGNGEGADAEEFRCADIIQRFHQG
ncbi:hypothetical protein D3C78_1035200 [compost metagenome]